MTFYYCFVIYAYLKNCIHTNKRKRITIFLFFNCCISG